VHHACDASVCISFEINSNNYLLRPFPRYQLVTVIMKRDSAGQWLRDNSQESVTARFKDFPLSVSLNEAITQALLSKNFRLTSLKSTQSHWLPATVNTLRLSLKLKTLRMHVTYGFIVSTDSVVRISLLIADFYIMKVRLLQTYRYLLSCVHLFLEQNINQNLTMQFVEFYS
jgi:hypothetical protein